MHISFHSKHIQTHAQTHPSIFNPNQTMSASMTLEEKFEALMKRHQYVSSSNQAQKPK